MEKEMKKWKNLTIQEINKRKIVIYEGKYAYEGSKK